MRNRSAWILAATMIVAGLFATASLPYLWRQVRTHVPALACPAYAQETMKFEPVPAESVSAAERRRAERLAKEAERRTEAVPAPPGHPDIPDIPEPPDAPDNPQFSHAGDVVRIGSDIHIEKGQEVEGDVFALRGDIRVDGHVKGNVAATGGNVTLGSSARIDGDVMCIGGKLEEEEGARVGGQRVTALRGNADGRIRRAIRRRIEEDLGPNFGKLSFALSWLLVSVALAWAIAKFAPNRTGGALVSLKREPGLNLMLGLGGVLMLVPSVVALALVVAILCITIIGIPLALGVLVAYAGLLVVLAFWGHAIGVIPIGERVVQRLGRAGTLLNGAVFGALAVAGLRLASAMFHFLPLFGWFANLLWVVAFLVGTTATLMGAGALIRTKFGQGPEGRWWPLFPRPVVAGALPAETGPSVSPLAPQPPASPPPAPMGGAGDPTPVG